LGESELFTREKAEKRKGDSGERGRNTRKEKKKNTNKR